MALFGNAHSIDPGQAQQEYARLLGQGEQVHAAYLLIRDTILFTDRRLILVDKQGITGKKTEYHSIPYRSITHFAVETAGHFDLDAELKIWLSGSQAPHPEDLHQGRRHLRGPGHPDPVRGPLTPTPRAGANVSLPLERVNAAAYAEHACHGRT
ncbi:hypothetical protein RKD37_004638 [Streptomyces ambofaciens]